MKSVVNGFSLSIKVECKCKMDSYKDMSRREHTDRSEEINGLDLNLMAEATCGFDSSDGDVDLKELVDLLNTNIVEEVAKQIHEQMPHSEPHVVDVAGEMEAH